MARAGGGRWTVETQHATVAEGGLDLDCGRRLDGVTVAYECYGRLNAARDNAILVCHALSGGAHAAGWHEGAAKPGWWDVLVGPGKALDTDRFFVISSNVLGSCYGTTGPSSIEPGTGRPYGSRFPVVTIADMVRVQRALVERLGIARLRAVAGGSMGGMQALQWAVQYPDAVASVIALATSPSHSPQQIAFNEIARRAVMSDPNWRGGDYYDGEPPRAGLAVARMLGHVTYLSDRGMERKFGRRRRPDARAYGFDAEFEVEGYLQHQGQAFVERFDANSLLYVTRAIDYFDLAPPGGTLRDAFAGSEADYLFLTFSSDWLYPPRHLEAAAEAAYAAGRTVSYREIPSDYGHDAFLLEHEAQAPLIRAFLDGGDRYNPWRHPSPEKLRSCPSPGTAASRSASPSPSAPS
jgi:homoserine O-acetyltransferase/O-succinyltransferase